MDDNMSCFAFLFAFGILTFAFVAFAATIVPVLSK